MLNVFSDKQRREAALLFYVRLIWKPYKRELHATLAALRHLYCHTNIERVIIRMFAPLVVLILHRDLRIARIIWVSLLILSNPNASILASQLGIQILKKKGPVFTQKGCRQNLANSSRFFFNLYWLHRNKRNLLKNFSHENPNRKHVWWRGGGRSILCTLTATLISPPLTSWSLGFV